MAEKCVCHNKPFAPGGGGWFVNFEREESGVKSFGFLENTATDINPQEWQYYFCGDHYLIQFINHQIRPVLSSVKKNNSNATSMPVFV